MRNSLLIAGVFIALLFGWPCMAEQQVDSSHAAKNQTSKPQQLIQPTHIVIDPPLPATSSESSPPAKPSYWKEAFAPANAPNWALVIVGGIAGFLAWLTVRAIQVQAAAQMNADRAWIAVEIQPFESDPEFWGKIDGTKYVYVQYGITNNGQTPAFIKAVGVKHYVLDSETEQLAEPVYGELLTVNTFLGAGKTTWNHIILTPSDFFQFNRNQQFLKICTKIVYEDIFHETHESVCRIKYHCPDGGNPVPKGFYQESDPKNNYYT